MGNVWGQTFTKVGGESIKIVSELCNLAPDVYSTSCLYSEFSFFAQSIIPVSTYNCPSCKLLHIDQNIKMILPFLFQVNLPRAVVIAVSLVIGLYLMVNVSYLTVMTPKELMSSSAVAVTWG